MKILITGGNGYLAKNMYEQFKDEYEVVSCNSTELDLLDTVKVYSFLKNNLFDVVLHTATYDAAPKYSVKDKTKVVENNLRMFFNLARGKEYFGRMFSFGSGAEFSRENWKPKMKESYFDQYIPSDQYGYSKYIMTKYIQSTDKIYNLRLFGVFGKYEDWRIRFISNACSHAVLDLPVRINQNVFIDYLYVDDLVDIVRRFVEQTPKYKVYNICSGKAHDLMTLAKKVVAVSGKDVEIVVKTAGLGKEYSGDNSLMMSEMEDFVPTPIDSSIKKLYGWYEKNRNMINLNIE